MERYLKLFKALSEKTRFRIARLLSQSNSSLCVCEITDSLGETQYNVSRHLKVLKSAGLVTESKKGRWVFYSRTPPAEPADELLWQAIAAIPASSFATESEFLKRRLALRKQGKCVVGVNSDEWKQVLTQLKSKGRKKHV